MKRQTMKIVLITGLICGLMVPALLTADIYMKQKQHTDAFEVMGQKEPAKDLITEVWIAKDKIRSNNEEQSMLILAEKGVTYFMDHANMTYTEMPSDFSKILEGTDDEEAAGMMQMMQGMMKMEVTITPTNETKKIGKWNCKKYLQKIESFMGPMESEIWATEDIKIDMQMYAQYAASAMAKMPGMQAAAEAMMKEMKKIKGVPVLTKASNTVMGQTINSSTELLEAREGKAPAGTFELPKGYKKTKMEMGR